MPDLLADPTTTMYVVFGAMVVVLGALALRRQKKSDVITFVVGAVLLLALFLVDRAFESPRESAVRVIQEMGTASRAKKHEDLFKHVSSSFKYRSLDKAGLQERAKLAEAMGFAGIAEYDLARSGFKKIDDSTVEQGFRVKHTGYPELHFYVVGTFKKDPDGEWRLTTFKLFDPVNVNDEKDIPGV
jgi:hypothetical protein